MGFAAELSKTVGKARACEVLGIPRASYYRWENPKAEVPQARPSPPRTLSLVERKEVLDVLDSERFANMAPREVYATLLDEAVFLCSVRTMYRILSENGEVRERRDQLLHPAYKKPELIATGPNQVWSWDITKLLGPTKWTYFYLYVVLDIFSRFAVGWMVARRESAALAKRLLQETTIKQGISPDQLTIHSDRGPSMASKTVAQLLGDLGITKTHSRPHVSNDNPFSEAQFKTVKYRPEFPERFGSPEDTHAFLKPFFQWYNWEHHHTGLALLTPGVVHYGLATRIIEARQRTLDAAYAAHPERFVRSRPLASQLPQEVWINPPDAGGTGPERPTAPMSQKRKAVGASLSDDLRSPRPVGPLESGLIHIPQHSGEELDWVTARPRERPPSHGKEAITDTVALLQ
jgi:putative transposase